MNTTQQLQNMIPAEQLQEIDRWIAKYPSDQKQSAVMQALMIVQECLGYLTEPAMDAVAHYLGMQPAAVYEVATFYSMYRLKPVGRHTIHVCTNISCQLRGADEIFEALQQKLGIGAGETTKDGRFSLCAVECLGACVQAPMMQVDKNYHEHLTIETLDDVLAEYP